MGAPSGPEDEDDDVVGRATRGNSAVHLLENTLGSRPVRFPDSRGAGSDELVQLAPSQGKRGTSEVFVMAKSAKRKTDNAVVTAADRTPTVPADEAAHVTPSDVARRAYDLYLARGCEPGHDVQDWLQAERELRRLIAA